jgi:Peptidase family M1 domain
MRHRACTGAPTFACLNHARIDATALACSIVALCLALLGGIALLGCTAPRPPAPPSSAPSKRAAAPPTADPQRADGEALRYEISARLRPEARHLEGDVKVELPAEPAGREALHFALRDDMEVTSAEVLEVAEGPARRSGFSGAAYEGFMQVRSDALADEVDVAFFGHEIGHQWWGLRVERADEDEGRDMLDEALAQYGALRVVEHLGGPAAGERCRRGEVGLGGLGATRQAARLMAAGHDLPLGRLPDNAGAYELADSKGYQIYALLSRTLGRDVFARALASVAQRHAFGALSWRAFLAELEASSGRDLRAFYAEWFERPGAPSLSIAWKQPGGGVIATVTQLGPTYRLGVPVQVEFDDGSAAVVEAKLEGASGRVTLPAPRPVRAVRLDPHGEVFRLGAALKAEAAALADFTRARLLWWPGKENGATEAMQILRGALERLPEPDLHGAEFHLRQRAGMIHHEGGRLREAMQEYERALATPVRPAEGLEGLYTSIAKTAQTQGDVRRAEWATRQARAAKLAAAKRLAGAP